MCRLVQLTVFIGVMGLATFALAIDYSVFSDQELLQLKDSVATFSGGEKDAYRHELRKRLPGLDGEERKQYESAIQSIENEESNNGKERLPFVIQGRGYDRGEGTVIFGGGGLSNPKRKDSKR